MSATAGGVAGGGRTTPTATTPAPIGVGATAGAGGTGTTGERGKEGFGPPFCRLYNQPRHPEARAQRASKDARPILLEYWPSPFEGRAAHGHLRMTDYIEQTIQHSPRCAVLQRCNQLNALLRLRLQRG